MTIFDEPPFRVFLWSKYSDNDEKSRLLRPFRQLHLRVVFFSIQQVFFIPDFSLLTSHHIGCLESVLVFLDPPHPINFIHDELFCFLFCIIIYFVRALRLGQAKLPSAAARIGRGLRPHVNLPCVKYTSSMNKIDRMGAYWAGGFKNPSLGNYRCLTS